MKDHDGTSQQKKPTKLKNIADKTEAFDSLHVKGAEVFKKNLLILIIDEQTVRNIGFLLYNFFRNNTTKWSIIIETQKKLNPPSVDYLNTPHFFRYPYFEEARSVY